MSVCRSDETGHSTFDASGGHVDVSGGHDAQTSDGALSPTNSSAQSVEIIHQDVDTIGRNYEASRSAFDASGCRIGLHILDQFLGNRYPLHHGKLFR